MASFEKPKAPTATAEAGKPAAKVVTASSSEAGANMVLNKEKVKRHDEQHHKDMDLAHQLQSAWKARVDAEHRPH